MLRASGLIRAALVGAVALAAPGLVAASEWGRLLAPAGAAVRAGGIVEVRWTALPAGVDEFELLLSVDDGRRFEIRLTEQLDPGVGLYSWRVPNLPSGRARLRLRFGIEGREIEGPPGPPFTIVGDETIPAAGLEHRRGEWWPVAGSPPVASWLARIPSRIRPDTLTLGAAEDSAVAPRTEDTAPVPTGWRHEMPARAGSAIAALRCQPGRPAPDPPLRP